VRILEEARILQAMGHEITIVTYHNGQDVQDLDIERTLSIPWRRDYEVGSSRHKVAFDVLLALKCAQFTWRQPDIIHAHLHEGVFVGYPMSRLWNVPLVFDFQGSMTSEMVDHHFLNADGQLYPIWLRLEQMLNRLPQAILTSSHHAAHLLEKEFGCSAKQVTPVLDCVNTQVFTPAWKDDPEISRLRQRYGIPANRQVIAYLGLLAKYQGTDLLLKVARKVIKSRPKVHFLIMGFPAVEQYRLEAGRLGISDHVTFTGRIAYPEKAPKHLALGDIAVAPKISATEGSGKLLNYMAMAMPTVAFDTQVSREYLGDKGVCVPLGDVEAFAQALVKLVDHPKQARAMGQKLRNRAQKLYSWERAGAQITDVYHRTLNTQT
jgi:glycosyltransferase involved in cell wall biosynthesis